MDSILPQDLNRSLTLCSAFEGQRLILSGTLSEVARAVKDVCDRGTDQQILIFDDATSHLIEVDLRGSPEEVGRRLSNGSTPEIAKRGPGRPKLGVVGREVTLLPRHWEWLDSQPGGASVSLRKLVELAKRASVGKDQARRAQEAVYRFMSSMAGDLPGYEEALRAFYAGDRAHFNELIREWPVGIQEHLRKLVQASTSAAEAQPEAGAAPISL